jgi:hypothetical protein
MLEDPVPNASYPDTIVEEKLPTSPLKTQSSQACHTQPTILGNGKNIK